MKDLIALREGVEFITISLIAKIEHLRKEYAHVAIGVYTDELFEKIFGRPPITPFEERLKLANSIKGVDWVFNASNQNEEETVRAQIFPRCNELRPYHIGLVPGTYDKIHLGHLQNFFIARKLCDILIAGVNSDKLVWENKGVKTHDSQEERFEIVNNLKVVDNVLVVETNDKRVINQQVMEIYNAPIDVIFLGSDLKGQDHQEYGIKIIFTDRDPEFQKKHSSTYLRKMLSNLLGENQ